jgi:ABC-type Mn2+/Zn2+ transport system permease subunit
MSVLNEILSPDFLLRNSLYISILAGLVCPIAGVYLVLRRMVFLGIALPQISSLGIAVALTIHALYGVHLDTHAAEEKVLAYAGALGFSLIAIILLSFAETRSKSNSESRLGAVYVIAMALSILILAQCPNAEKGWLNLLKGEIIAISDTDLIISAIGFGIVIICFLLFNREFTLMSFDREMALALRKNVVFWDVFLFVLLGTIIAVSVISVGPLVAFGFAIIPPLIVRHHVSSIRAFIVFSSLCGVVGAFCGFIISYKNDLPLGPTDVVLLGIAAVISYLCRKTIVFIRKIKTIKK